METLAAITQNKNHYHYCGPNRGCLQPGGDLSSPSKYYCMSTAVIGRARSALPPKTTSRSVDRSRKNFKRNERSCTIPIASGGKFENKWTLMNDDLYITERWAGPTYSNSPPPSSLPMPKFSFQPKPSVSVNLVSSPSKIDLYCDIKPVPSSRIREGRHLTADLENSDSATKTLRRILNLD